MLYTIWYNYNNNVVMSTYYSRLLTLANVQHTVLLVFEELPIANWNVSVVMTTSCIDTEEAANISHLD